MDPCLFLSSLEAIKPQSLLQRGIQNTTLFTPLMETFITTFAMHTKMLSQSLVFLLYQKVRLSFNIPSNPRINFEFFWSMIADREYANNDHFRKFCRQLFHSSLAAILEPLKLGMSKPEVVLCPDGHYRRAIYAIGPYIADYPEQVLLACVVQDWCPRFVSLSDSMHQLLNDNSPNTDALLCHKISTERRVCDPMLIAMR